MYRDLNVAVFRLIFNNAKNVSIVIKRHNWQLKNVEYFIKHFERYSR